MFDHTLACLGITRGAELLISQPLNESHILNSPIHFHYTPLEFLLVTYDAWRYSNSPSRSVGDKRVLHHSLFRLAFAVFRSAFRCYPSPYSSLCTFSKCFTISIMVIYVLQQLNRNYGFCFRRQFILIIKPCYVSFVSITQDYES